jgi:hypothetical protein
MANPLTVIRAAGDALRHSYGEEPANRRQLAELIEAEVLVAFGTKASGAGGRPAGPSVWLPEQDRWSGSILATPTCGWCSRPWTGPC